MDLAKRSIYQLLEQYTESGNEKPKSNFAIIKHMQHSFKKDFNRFI